MTGLFDMSEAELDRAVQEHYGKMYDDYYRPDDPEPCCGNCGHYCQSEGICSILERNLTAEEAAEMEENDDYSAICREEDDYCIKWDARETEYPDWMDGD